MFGKEKGWCPYFLARHMVQFANVVVYSYQYLLDPKVAGIISKEMQRESVVVFDEAHNIDNVCIEALSVSVRRQTIEGATRNINKMAQEINRYILGLLVNEILFHYVQMIILLVSWSINVLIVQLLNYHKSYWVAWNDHVHSKKWN